MTDRIDLDDLDAEPDENESAGTDGDWLWRDDADAPPETPPSGATTTDDRSSETIDDADEADNAETRADAAGTATRTDDSDPADAPAPHVPKTGAKKPAGIPVKGSKSNGATGQSTRSTEDASQSTGRGSSDIDASAARPMGADEASGPHGGGTDDMTMAITYNAVRDLERPDRVFAGAMWADWIGIVGDVPAHVIGKFQREHGIDADFFNGTGTGPGERLTEIDRNSMFYADRLVVVGREGEDEPIAEEADWEFVPLAEAATKADWELESETDME